MPGFGVKRVGIEYTAQVVPVHISPSSGVIPTAFIKLDENVSAADSYVNIRDEIVKRQNHNIILAQRSKRNILHAGLDDSSGWANVIGQRTRPDPFWGAPDILVPLFLSQHTKEIEVVIRCCQSRTKEIDDTDPTLSCIICPTGMTRPTVAAVHTQTITTAYDDEDAMDNYTFTIPVPHLTGEAPIIGGQLACELYIMAQLTKRPTVDHAAVVVVNAKDTWIECTDPAPPTSFDRHVIVTSGGEEKLAIRTEVPIGAGTTNRLYLDEPWTSPPMVGDTVDFYDPLYIKLGSISIYELNTTTFVGYVGAY